MELEAEGQLAFLDIQLIRHTDGSIGHAVYRKPTHTNLYLFNQGCHHPALKGLSVLATLVDRAHKIADEDHLPRRIGALNSDC